MIRIQLTSASYGIQKVQISGHAQSGPYGQDLVCCAVSAVSIGALNALDQMCPDQCSLILENNRIVIEVLHSTEKLQTCLQMLEYQLLSLEESNPKFMKIQRTDRTA